MNEEGDIPSVTETDKSTAPTLFQRFGSLTGKKKSKNKLAIELSEENEDLQLKVSQLTKEVEENTSEIDRYKRELEDDRVKWNRELDLNKAEFDRYKMESEFEKKTLTTQMESQLQLKAKEIEYLKKVEADSNSRLADDKNEIKSKSEEIAILKNALLKSEADSKTLISQLEGEIKMKSDKIENIQRELEDERAKWKLESDATKAEFDRCKMESQCEKKVQMTEIEYLKKIEADSKIQLTEMKSEMKSKSEEIENLKRELENVRTSSKREGDALNEKLEANRAEFDRYKMMSDSRIAQLESEVKLKSAQNENLKIAHLKPECESKNRITQLEFKLSDDLRKVLEKVEKNSIDLRSLHNQTTDMTIREKFTGISKLTDYKVYSRVIQFAGCNWRIILHKSDDYLGIHLDVQKTNAVKWSCSTLGKFQLISQKTNDVVHCESMIPVVYDGKTDWGIPKFISFKDLLDDEKGYVKDDSIIVAAVIQAFPDI